MHGALDDRVRRLGIHHVQQNVNHFIPSHSKNRGAKSIGRTYRPPKEYELAAWAQSYSLPDS